MPTYTLFQQLIDQDPIAFDKAVLARLYTKEKTLTSLTNTLRQKKSTFVLATCSLSQKRSATGQKKSSLESMATYIKL